MPSCSKYVDKIEHCFKKLTEQCKKNTDLQYKTGISVWGSNAIIKTKLKRKQNYFAFINKGIRVLMGKQVQMKESSINRPQ